MTDGVITADELAQVRDRNRRAPAELQAMDRRTPVGVSQSGDQRPVVVCRDGSVWELRSVWDSRDGVTQFRKDEWQSLPPVPGSHAAGLSKAPTVR